MLCASPLHPLLPVPPWIPTPFSSLISPPPITPCHFASTTAGSSTSAQSRLTIFAYDGAFFGGGPIAIPEVTLRAASFASIASSTLISSPVTGAAPFELIVRAELGRGGGAEAGPEGSYNIPGFRFIGIRLVKSGSTSTGPRVGGTCMGLVGPI